MAFPTSRRSALDRLTIGAELFLYTTRACFGNTTRDPARLIGIARTTGPVTPLDPPEQMTDRMFHFACPLEIDGVTPARSGPEFSTYVDGLESLAGPGSWGPRMQRTLVPVTSSDAELLRRVLKPDIRPLPDVLGGYIEAAKHRHDHRLVRASHRS